SSALRPAEDRSHTRRWRPQARRPISLSTSAWRRRPPAMPTTFFTNGSLRAITILPPVCQAALLAINSADDERNPPETGITERELKRVKNGRLYLIPASEDTRGHATTGMAKFWSQPLHQLLQTAPRRPIESAGRQ